MSSKQLVRLPSTTNFGLERRVPTVICNDGDESKGQHREGEHAQGFAAAGEAAARRAAAKPASPRDFVELYLDQLRHRAGWGSRPRP